MKDVYEEGERGFRLKSWRQIVCVSMIISLLCLSIAFGADYPTKTIQLVIPFPPGGTADLAARLMSKNLSTHLGQPVVVVNKSGGSGTIGIQSVATSAPDGHIILVSTPTVMTAPLTMKGVPFTFKDFTAVNLAVDSPGLVSVRKDAPWKTLEEMIAEAKKNPGKLTYSSSGPSTLTHTSAELFKMVTGTNITHIPMDGQAKAIIAVLGGHVDTTFHVWGGIKGHYENGSLRALAVMSPHRLKELPSAPTTAELGYPGILESAWVGFFVPAKTSTAVVRKLSAVIKEALKDREIIKSFGKLGSQIRNLGPEEAAKFLSEDQKTFSDVLKMIKAGQ